MSHLAAHPTRVLACLVVMACGARAEEATTATPTADQSKVTVGAMLMSDYIYLAQAVTSYREASQRLLYCDVSGIFI